MRISRTRGGSALLISIVVSTVIVAIAGSLMTVSLVGIRGAAVTYEAQKAVCIAEAGVDDAISQLNDPSNPPPAQFQIPQTSFDGGTYQVTAVKDAGGAERYEITSVGIFNGIRKGVEVVVAASGAVPPPPVSPDAAFTVFGPGNASSDIDMKKNPGAAAPPIISGIPGSVPGVLIEDPTTYANIDIDTTGGAAILGSPAKMQNSNASFGGAYWENIRQNLLSKVQNELIPDPSALVISNGDIGTSVTWGTPASPGIFVVNDDLKFTSNSASLTGYGTLIVNHGDLDFSSKTATLNWTGNIIVLGDTVYNKKGTMNINGNLWLLAEGTTKPRIRFTKVGSSTNTINGSMLLLGGGSASSLEAEIEFESGVTTINGLLVLQGKNNGAELDVDEETTGVVNPAKVTVNGAVAVGVMDSSRIHIEIDDAQKFIFDGVKANAAIQSLHDFAGNQGTPSGYLMSAWREFLP